MVKKNKLISYNNYDALRNKDIIIWCCSVSGLNLYLELYNAGLHVIGFADSARLDTAGGSFAALPVFSLMEMEAMGGCTICIATKNYKSQAEILNMAEKIKGAEVYARNLVLRPGIYNEEEMRMAIIRDKEMIDLVRGNLADERSLDVFEHLLEYRVSNQPELLEKSFENGHFQYFPITDIMQPGKNEIFIDAGAYDGNTSVQFAKWAPNYKEIYAMEPGPVMKNILRGTIELHDIKNITVVESGAYSRSGFASFSESSQLGSSKICEEACEGKISVITIDEMLKGKMATYIKMDIEGAEMEALLGAEYTIGQYRPKLAISIYHQEDDLWRIPAYLIEKYPWYKFYIRHYSKLTIETVLYAV